MAAGWSIDYNNKYLKHQLLEAPQRTGSALRPTILNGWADQLAGEGAARHETRPFGIDLPRQLGDTTWKIQRRIAEVTKHIAENFPISPTAEEKK